MDKFTRILNIIIKIILDMVVFGMFLINAALFRAIYDKVLPGVPDWPAQLFVFLMGTLFTYVISRINRDNIIK